MLGLYPNGRTRRVVPAGLDLREHGNPIDPPTMDRAVRLPFNARPGTAAELGAAQAIDAIGYGVNGSAAVACPDVVSAYASRDETAVSAALERASVALDRAGTLITPG